MKHLGLALFVTGLALLAVLLCISLPLPNELFLAPLAFILGGLFIHVRWQKRRSRY